MSDRLEVVAIASELLDNLNPQRNCLNFFRLLKKKVKPTNHGGQAGSGLMKLVISAKLVLSKIKSGQCRGKFVNFIEKLKSFSTVLCVGEGYLVMG